MVGGMLQMRRRSRGASIDSRVDEVTRLAHDDNRRLPKAFLGMVHWGAIVSGAPVDEDRLNGYVRSLCWMTGEARVRADQIVTAFCDIQAHPACGAPELVDAMSRLREGVTLAMNAIIPAFQASMMLALDLGVDLSAKPPDEWK
jgi:hypothetical protein